jgi:hypothetical protein
MLKSGLQGFDLKNVIDILSFHYIFSNCIENCALHYTVNSGNYHDSLHNDPEERSSQLLHCRSLKSCIVIVLIVQSLDAV